MIESTRSAQPAPRVDRVALPGQSAARLPQPRADRLSAEGVAFLGAELRRQPEIRPEVLERARALAADPNYPAASINRGLAELILAAPDLSEDHA